MQEYRRHIAYLYAYEHGMKMRSVGFSKAEERSGRLRIEIHMKSYCYPGEEAGKAYIYFYQQNRMIGIYLGNLENCNDYLEWQGLVDADNILNTGISFAQTKGIWIRRTNNRNYVAEWNDGSVDISRFALFPKGGQKCIQCPRFGNCERSRNEETDRRGKIYEGSHSAGT